MAKNEENWLTNYEALKAHVAEAGHFPDKQSRLNNWCRYQRKCIKAGRIKRDRFQ